MQNRMAAMSVVVRADGVNEAFYNGQRDRVVECVKANAEAQIDKIKTEAEALIKQAKADVERERSWAAMQSANCNRFRANSIADLKAQQSKKSGAIRTVRHAVGTAWACIWYSAAHACKAVRSAAELAWAYFYAIFFCGGWIDILIGIKMLERITEEELNEQHKKTGLRRS